MEFSIEIDVIFVDDNREICDMMKAYFHLWGLRKFKIFSDVHEAVEYCLSQDLGIAIFIIDYKLAGQTGLFFLDQVRRKFPNAYTDAIILSGHCGAYLNDLCSSAGVWHVLQKPFDCNRLYNEMASIAEKYEPYLGLIRYGSPLVVELVIKVVAERDQGTFLKSRSDRMKSELVSPPSKALMTSLLAQTDRLSGLAAQLGDMGYGGTIHSLVHKIRNEAKHCSIYSRLFNTIFYDSAVELFEFDINETLKMILGLTSKPNTHQLKLDLWETCIVRSDKKMVEQVLFVFLSYINDYFFGENGQLFIRNSTIEGGSQTSMQEEKCIEFQFQISNGRAVSNDKNRILIVDDDKSLATYIARLFNNENFEVFTAASGHECLDFIADNRVDLVILDIRMMGMQGTEVLQNLRKNIRYRNVPVILYSSYLEADNIADVVSEFDIYHPVRLLSKTQPTSVLLKLSEELLNQGLRYDSLEKLFANNIEASIKSDPILRMGFYPVQVIAQQLPLSVFFQESAEMQTMRIGFKPAENGVSSAGKTCTAKSRIGTLRSDLMREVYRMINHVINNRIQLISLDIITLKNEHAAEINDMGILDDIQSVIDGFASVLGDFRLVASPDCVFR
jgi:CheY-like chemotaxis protein